MKREVKSTNNYDMFKPHTVNRDTLNNRGIPKNSKVLRSMRAEGFWPHEPIIVYRDPADQKLVIAFGHNRYSIAKFLKVPLYYLEADGPIDPRTQKPKDWRVADYVDAELKAGNYHYLVLRNAYERISNSSARACVASALAGDPFQTVGQAVQDGVFEVTDEGQMLFRKLVRVVDSVDLVGGKARFPFLYENKALSTLCAILLIPGIDVARLAEAIRNHEDKIRKQGSRNAYIDMFDELYNFRRANNRLDLITEVKKVVVDRRGLNWATQWLKA
jgi:hypothetical protein